MEYIKRLTTLIILLFWGISAFAYNLPDLGEVSETFISKEKERQLGKQFMIMVRSNLHLLGDPVINDYIQKLGNKLTKGARTRIKNFNFFVVDDSAINAFAGPDAHIGINSGTIISQKSEDMLAAIMAHEIAHVTQHHIARLIRTARNTQLASAAGMLAAIIVGATANKKSLGSITTGATMASLGGGIQNMISFTKQHEIEADNIGMRILYNSGFDPNAMPEAFLHMQRLRLAYSNDVPTFLLTHPVTSDRIAETKNRANLYKFKRKPKKSNFSLIQARTKVVTEKNTEKLLRDLLTELKTSKKKDKTDLEYSYALALYKNLDFAKAKKAISPLVKKNPQEILFQLLAAQIESSTKQKGKAIERLKNALTSNKNYYPLAALYAKTLTEAKQSKKAISFIRSKIRSYPNNSHLYLLLSQAYAQEYQKAKNHKKKNYGDYLGEAYIARAKVYEIEDYKKEALRLLQQAAKISKLSSNNRAIINARIKQLERRLAAK